MIQDGADDGCLGRSVRLVLSCYYYSVIVLYCQLIQCSAKSSLTRDKLLNIRETTPVDLFPTFLLLASELVGFLVKAALGSAQAGKCRRRRKCAEALFGLCRHGDRKSVV